jgi:hypothetical protein
MTHRSASMAISQQVLDGFLAQPADNSPAPRGTSVLVTGRSRVHLDPCERQSSPLKGLDRRRIRITSPRSTWRTNVAAVAGARTTSGRSGLVSRAGRVGSRGLREGGSLPVDASEPEGRPDVHESLGQRPRADPDDQDRDRPALIADRPQPDAQLQNASDQDQPPLLDVVLEEQLFDDVERSPEEQPMIRARITNVWSRQASATIPGRVGRMRPKHAEEPCLSQRNKAPTDRPP